MMWCFSCKQQGRQGEAEGDPVYRQLVHGVVAVMED